MKGEFTAIIEAATEGGYWAICPEVLGANGQGETIEEAKESLKSAIQLIFEDRLADMNYAEMQSLAMRVGVSPYIQRPNLKKALIKEFRNYNLNARGKLLPLTTNTIQLDKNNPQHQKTLKILGDF